MLWIWLLVRKNSLGPGRESSDGFLAFDSRFHLQRAALLLDKGRLYVAFASYGDFGAYHGWVITYDATTLKQTGSWVTTPNGYQGGIWMGDRKSTRLNSSHLG